MTWKIVDEGWGRRAADFAAMAEPSNSREYVHVHSLLEVKHGDSLLDIACGSGLAMELASMRGARVAGIDASKRLANVAKDRNPESEVIVGDMNDLPWDDNSFDVVTSFRGIWGTTPAAMSEAWRVLRPGGRAAITIWGDVGRSPGGWMFEPFRWAGTTDVEHQAEMVSLGRPGLGEAFLEAAGFDVAPRVQVPFFMEYADPEAYARALAASGPAFEAIQAIGEEAFLQQATELAEAHVRPGLPLRAEIQLFGYIGSKR